MVTERISLFACMFGGREGADVLLMGEGTNDEGDDDNDIIIRDTKR